MTNRRKSRFLVYDRSVGLPAVSLGPRKVRAVAALRAKRECPLAPPASRGGGMSQGRAQEVPASSMTHGLATGITRRQPSRKSPLHARANPAGQQTR